MPIVVTPTVLGTTPTSVPTGSGSLLDSTDSYSGYGPTTPTEVGDDEDGSVATPSQSECSEDGSGCLEVVSDTEGLIDDEDYGVTEPPTNHERHSTASGSGEVGSALEPGTEQGSETGQDDTQGRRPSRHRRHSKRNRRNMHMGVAGEAESSVSGQGDFQGMVREIVEKKRLFEARLSEARALAKTSKKSTTASPGTPPTTAGGAGLHGNEMQHHARSRDDRTTEEENPAIIHLHKPMEMGNDPTLHRA